MTQYCGITQTGAYVCTHIFMFDDFAICDTCYYTEKKKNYDATYDCIYNNLYCYIFIGGCFLFYKMIWLVIDTVPYTIDWKLLC